MREENHNNYHDRQDYAIMYNVCITYNTIMYLKR
jgi:hypothetical protein